MRKKAKTTFAKVCSLALIGSLLIPSVNGSEAEAAAKAALSKKTVSLTVGKTAKLTVKGKKIKKTTWTVKNTKIAKLSAKKKTSVKIKGVKKGSTKLTAKVKVGKKVQTLSATVKVQAASPKVTKAPTATAEAPVSSAPAVTTEPIAPDTTDNPAPVTPTAVPTAVPTPEPEPVFSADFEDGTVGNWFARYGTTSTKPTKLSISSEAHSGNGALLTSDRERAWNSPGIDLLDTIVPGGKYKISMWAKVPDADTANAKGINIRMSIEYKTSEDAEAEYANIPADKNQKILQSEWTYIEEEFTMPASLSSLVFYVETNGKATAQYLIDDVKFICLSTPGTYDSSLDSLKETYAQYIPNFGVATTYAELLNENSLGFIKHHFNSITMGNSMKLDALIKEETMKITDPAAAEYVTDDDYAACEDNKDADGDVIVPVIDFTEMDKVLQLAKENGLKVRVHSPFWHQQNPKQFFTKQFTKSDTAEYTDEATMYAREEMYTKTLLNHISKCGYGDVVSAYDVVNEYINMANEGETYENYWKHIFGSEMKTDSEYVKRAFLYAREGLEMIERDDIALIYNDYNTYDNTDKVIALINNINKTDDINPDGKKLCDGIGMQAHINYSGTTAEMFENAIAAFAAEGFEIQITELDVTNTGTVTADTTEEQKAKVWEANAKMYGELMTAVLNQVKAGANITSLTIWGTTDAGSWRPTKAPVLFGESVADKKPSFDAVINAAKNFK